MLSLLISLPLIMGSLGNPDQLGNLLGLGVLLLLLGLAVLFSKFRRKENPCERAARDLLSHARDFQQDTQAEALLFLPDGIGYTVPEGVELSEPGLLDYGKLEAMVETADLWLMVAEQKGMILQKREFQGDPDSFRTFLQEKGSADHTGIEEAAIEELDIRAAVCGSAGNRCGMQHPELCDPDRLVPQPWLAALWAAVSGTSGLAQELGLCRP